MKTKKVIYSLLIVLLCLNACQSDGGSNYFTSEENDGHDKHEASSKGLHGGKLFEENGFAIEVTIYEPDIPPQSRVYVYDHGKPIDPSLVTLVTKLKRIDRIDTIRYRKQDDYLIGDKIVEEPHSFDVSLNAIYKGNAYNWSYSSYEGRTNFSDEAISSSGIKIEKAESATISSYTELYGRIVPNKFKVVELSARYPGVVKEIRKLPGDKVEKGDVLATVEASESLKTYEIISPQSGVIFEINAGPGNLIADSTILMTVGDLSSVWAELNVSKSEFKNLKLGQKVLVYSDADKLESANQHEGRIIYLSPFADGDTQSRFARVEILNPKFDLVPELFVEVKVVIEQRQVPVTVKVAALQKFRDWDVVFKKVGHDFEIAILELGEKDGDVIEVKEGLSSGVEYVSENSFVVKADVMKSGASHDH